MVPFSAPKGLPMPFPPGALSLKPPGMGESMNMGGVETPESQRRRIELIVKDKEIFKSANP